MGVRVSTNRVQQARGRCCKSETAENKQTNNQPIVNKILHGGNRRELTLIIGISGKMETLAAKTYI